MQYLKADTAVKVVIGPVVAVGDGFTPVTTLSLSTADEAEILKHDAAAVTDISGNTFAAITSADGYYNLTITAAQLDTEGMLTVLINDDSLCLPVKATFMVVNANVYDSLFAAAGTDTLDVQVAGMDASTLTATAIATDAITSDKIAANAIGASELATDAIGDAQIATGAIASTAFAAGAIDAAAIANGAVDAATFAAGAIDAAAIAADAIDLIWDEPLSGHATGGTTGKALRDAGGIILHSGTSDNVPANTSTTISLETGAASTTDDIYTHQTIIIVNGTGAGQARVIADYDGATNQSATVTPAWDVTPDATSEYEIVPGVVHAETQGGGYEDGSVFVDTVNGTAGTQLYVNGTVDNPVDSIASAKTIADALNLKKFSILGGSAIALGATYSGYAFTGRQYTLDLGSQNISNSYFNGAELLASTGTGTEPIFEDCVFDNAVTLPPCVIRYSYLGDVTITAGSAGNFFINHCVSRAAGAAVAPNFDFGAALNASNLNMRNWSGGIELENMGTGTGTYNASIEGNGQVIINANCSATSNLALRGSFNLTDNAGGAVTVTYDQVQTDLNTITGSDGVTLATAQALYAPAKAGDAMDLIANAVDAAAIATGAIDNDAIAAGAITAAEASVNVSQISDSATAADNLEASALGIVPGACEGSPSTTVIQTDLAEATDDHYIGRIVVFTSGNAAGEATDITDYTGSTGTITVTALTTAPAATDTFVIV